MGSDDPTLPGRLARRRSENVESARRGMSVSSLRALDAIEPHIIALEGARGDAARIEAVVALIRAIRDGGDRHEATIDGLREELTTALQKLELLDEYRKRCARLSNEVGELREQLRAVRGGR